MGKSSVKALFEFTGAHIDCGGVCLCLRACVSVYICAYWVPTKCLFPYVFLTVSKGKKFGKALFSVWQSGCSFSLGFPPPGKSHGLHLFGILKVFPSQTQTGKALRPQMGWSLQPQWQMKPLTSFLSCIIWKSWITSVSWHCKKVSTGITGNLLSIRANLHASI